ncbi:unnamed protein product [Schistocephalus solidus]|uniref:Uncharacterized protein n=1 Tax=Schistocephalus solidus TaxID=70667 RepID=A0A183T4D0_SCHSO|nr:unnamed protein product [Schistocephalus solidus]
MDPKTLQKDLDALKMDPEMKPLVEMNLKAGNLTAELIFQLILTKILGLPKKDSVHEITGTTNFLGPNCLGEPSYKIDDGEFEDPPGKDILTHYTDFAEYVRCDYHPRPSIAPTIDQQLQAWDQCSLVFLILLSAAIACIFLFHLIAMFYKCVTKYKRVLDRVIDPDSEAATQAAMWNETCLNTFTPDYVWYTNFKPQGFEFDPEVHSEFQKLEDILYKLSHA